jgi:hypothetical protein
MVRLIFKYLSDVSSQNLHQRLNHYLYHQNRSIRLSAIEASVNSCYFFEPRHRKVFFGEYVSEEDIAHLMHVLQARNSQDSWEIFKEIEMLRLDEHTKSMWNTYNENMPNKLVSDSCNQ